MATKEQFKALLEQMPRKHYDLPTKTALLLEFPALKSDFPSLTFTSISVLKAGQEQKFLSLEGNLPLEGEKAVQLRVIYLNKYPKTCPSVHIVPRAGERVVSREWVKISGNVKTQFMKNWRKKDNTAALLRNLREIMTQEDPIFLEIMRKSMANIGICFYDETHMTTKACICAFPAIRICSACLEHHIAHTVSEKYHYLYDSAQLDSIESEIEWENTHRQLEALYGTINDLHIMISGQIETSKIALESTVDRLIRGIKERQELMVNRLNEIGTKRLEELGKMYEEALRLVLKPEYRATPGTLEALVLDLKGADLPENLLQTPNFGLDFEEISRSLDQIFSLFPPLTKVSFLPVRPQYHT